MDESFYIGNLQGRVDTYEELLDPRNIINPKYHDGYKQENKNHFSDENNTLQCLLKKDPSKLIEPEKTRIVILLRAQGFTISEICKKVELSKPTVIKTIKKFSTQISKLKGCELEELLQTYSLTLKMRIHSFGKILGTLFTELETRNLKELSTDKLIDLILKCQKAVSEDILAKIANDVEKEDKVIKAGLL